MGQLHRITHSVCIPSLISLSNRPTLPLLPPLPPIDPSSILSLITTDVSGQIVRTYSLPLCHTHSLSQNASPSAKYRLCPGSVQSFFYMLDFLLYDLFPAYRPIGYPGIPPGAPDRPQAAVKGVSVTHHLTPSFVINQSLSRPSRCAWVPRASRQSTLRWNFARLKHSLVVHKTRSTTLLDRVLSTSGSQARSIAYCKV